MRRVALIFLLPFALTACDTVREQMGMSKQAPDEFQVVTKAPLVMPPEFNLRPPEPGAPSLREAQPRVNAQAALMGRAPDQMRASPTIASPGEAALLNQAGAGRADPNIRRTISQEYTQLADKDRSFVDRLIFWQRTAAASGTVVDPRAEQQRLRENARTGQGPTTGQTPVIERRRRGLLEGIF